jgi:hypothetical protein
VVLRARLRLEAGDDLQNRSSALGYSARFAGSVRASLG